MFEIRERAANGRIGRLTTKHGTVTTPTLLPVINPNLNRVTPRQMKQRHGAQMVITNSYIIRKTPALHEKAVKDGVHKLLDWDGPVMTDSGTFQAYVYGDVDVTPEEVVEFQKAIGVDVGTLLDVFTVPETGHEQAEAEMRTTLERTRKAAQAKGDMLLAATVQGGVHLDLREECARELGSIHTDVNPIGGVVPLMEQARYAELTRVILAAKRGLPAGRPVHLFGAGHPLVFPLAAALGCDLFDSASYAKYAKDGRMMFPWGTRSLDELTELPCHCASCQDYANAKELLKAPEGERLDALTHHNLAVSFAEIRRVQQAIHDGDLWELVEERAAQNPALADALRVLKEPQNQIHLERAEPLSGTRALQYRGHHTLARPAVARLHRRILERWTPTKASCLLLPATTKPYSEYYQPRLKGLLNHDPVVETPLGPIPLELDLVWPVAQNVMPQTLDAESQAIIDAYRDAFFKKFDGCDVLPFEPEDAPGEAEGPSHDTLDEFDSRRVRSVARHQFGIEAGDALTKGTLTFRRSPSNRRVRNIKADDVHVASLRARDGLLSLTMDGAKRIMAAGARHRLTLGADAAPFIAEGKNPMAKFVESADQDLRPGDECLLVGPGDVLLAIGRMHLAGWEIGEVERGPAARNRGKAEKDEDA
jgi:7-cyano-7-deazaguanine tRNA-ribosyltransferase